jgi:hypothetical protein
VTNIKRLAYFTANEIVKTFQHEQLTTVASTIKI